MSRFTSFPALAAVGVLLPACMIVPISEYPPVQPFHHNNTQVTVVPMSGASATRAPYVARLYPGNPIAARMGGVSGVITNPEQGHGEFSFTVGGETFTGEATRIANSPRGIANASGNRGGFARCDYSMATAQRGLGSCTFSSGARFDMHIAQ
ncbi:MAG: hypothetical protein V4723_10480 [Pseudomonadota bacterium]